MKTPTPESPLDRHREFIERSALTGWPLSDIAKELRNQHNVDTTRHSIRRSLRRWGVVYGPASGPPNSTEGAGFHLDGDRVRVTSEAEPVSGPIPDHDALLRERGLDPDDWDVENLIVNEWDGLGPEGEVVRLRQLKVHCRRKVQLGLIVPARVPGDYIRPRFARTMIARTEPDLVVLCGDQQAPHIDPTLHELFLAWLDENRPERGVLMGDTMDLPTISRHPAEPEWAPSTQECIDSAYRILRDYVLASEATNWQKLAGNHDERLRRAIINNIPDLYRLRPGVGEGEANSLSIFDPAFLLRLDELGIHYVEANGSYEHAQIKIGPFLAARHGWLARKGSGSSALATLSHLGFSVVVGHTHRQSLVHQTVHSIDGKPQTFAAAETGCMCRIQDGLGYAVAPDWQNGFATASLWPSGEFKLDLGTYVDGALYWRDQRFT